MTKKKPYDPPRLTVHGNLVQVTQAKGGNLAEMGVKPATRLAHTADT
jgi:hypothetical protein